MKVVLLNTYDWGGAGTATRRIHRGLIDEGVDSSLLVGNKRGDDPTVYGPDGTFRRIYSMARILLDQLPLKPFGGVDADFSLGWMPDDIRGRMAELDPDIIHLNWVGEGFLNVKTLKKIDQPIVWRLPDMWAITGGCHYSKGCERFTNGCGTCPQLPSNTKHDPTWWTHRRKRKAWSDLDIVIVTPSDWLKREADQSSVFQNIRIKVIPNGLDTDTFRPYQTDLARELFHLPPDKKIILFGSVSPTSDPRKGFDLLRDALRSLASSFGDDDILVVVFGASKPENTPELGFDTRYLGYFHDEETLALLYAAADVMVVPSRYEGFGQTVTEAMACGTPVVAFDATGPSDTVVHKKTGYLAQPYEPGDFADGIRWLLNEDDRRNSLASNARNRAVENYEISKVSSQYVELYEDLLGQE